MHPFGGSQSEPQIADADIGADRDLGHERGVRQQSRMLARIPASLRSSTVTPDPSNTSVIAAGMINLRAVTAV
jgi:hypothetical protein